MAMLNAPTMECDRVNLRRSVPVQKRQQIFETVRVRHRGTLSDEVAPLPEQVEPHYSTVPFAHNVKGNIRKRGQGCPSPCRLARPWRYQRRGRSSQAGYFAGAVSLTGVPSTCPTSIHQTTEKGRPRVG